jgi:hypothetical protein
MFSCVCVCMQHTYYRSYLHCLKQATIRQHLVNVAAMEEKERSEMLAMSQGTGNGNGNSNGHGNGGNKSIDMDMNSMMSMMGGMTNRLSKAQKRRLRAKQRK